MNNSENFENQCCKYLLKKYGKYADFILKGGMNSSVSDIAVIKNGFICYYIEVKMNVAQSGQFVLIPDKTSNSFIFSPRNRSKPNHITKYIIEYMNSDFKKYENAGTSGQIINLSSNLFSEWIVSYYKSKSVKYIISSFSGNYIIFPVEKFSTYFNITAKYRIKKSGSQNITKKDIDPVKNILSKIYQDKISFSEKNKKLFAYILENVNSLYFSVNSYNYYLSAKENNLYEIRKLSTTRNMNVIFTITSKQKQKEDDLLMFEQDLYPE